MANQLPQPRPQLWREMNAAQMAPGHPSPEEMLYTDAILAMRAIRAAEIRAVADTAEQHFTEHGGTWSDVVEWLRCQAQIAEASK